MAQSTKPWRKRWEIPDAQIRDAADQYEAARKLLARQPPFSGLLLPLMNVAAVAIELYLKCLSAELVHTPDEDFPNGFIVSAAPTRWGHKLASLFAEIPDDLKRDIESEFKIGHSNVTGQTFLETLKRCDGAFAESRYPFEKGKDITKYPLGDLMLISEFFSVFVSKLPPKEYIEW